MRLVLAAGVTRTAQIEGLSAAGATREVMVQTPSADAEVVTYGDLVRSPVVPVSPTGCPTPAVVTRAVLERLGFDLTVVDAGLVAPTGAPTVRLGATAGADVRDPDPVPEARDVFESAREFAGSLPDDELVLAETIPGGTTTALGVLTALGERAAVSSSLPTNPLERKREVVAEGLTASGLEPGGARGDPLRAVRRMGDPVLATVAGLTVGALEAGIDVTLGGGTQLVAAAALVRHAGVEDPLSLATTSFVAADETAEIRAACERLDIDLVVSDPGFETSDHVAAERFRLGEAKEGAGMGGALALAARAGVPMAEVRSGIVDVYDRLLGDDAP